MSRVRFLLDEHGSHAVAEALRRRRIDIFTSADAGLLGAPGEVCLAYASDTERVVVTSDSDFLRLHRELPHAGIAFSEHRAGTVGQLVAGLVLTHPARHLHQVCDMAETSLQLCAAPGRRALLCAWT